MFYPQERVGLFIDGSNLYAAARSLGFDIDYKRLLEMFSKQGHLVRAFYYTALLEEQEYSPIRPLVDWLDYNGYTMVTKFSGDGDFRRLVEAVQRKGLKVTVVSTVRSQPPMIADELRRQADYFLELRDLEDLVTRKGGKPLHESHENVQPSHPDTPLYPELEEEAEDDLAVRDPEAYLGTAPHND